MIIRAQKREIKENKIVEETKQEVKNNKKSFKEKEIISYFEEEKDNKENEEL